MININDCIVRTQDLISSEIDGELIMLSIENGKYYGLNTLGSYIWKLLESPHSVHHLCEKLTDDFVVSQEQCEQEILTFLNKLATDNLIKVIAHVPKD